MLDPLYYWIIESVINILRKADALISLSLGSLKYFPSFCYSLKAETKKYHPRQLLKIYNP